MFEQKEEDGMLRGKEEIMDQSGSGSEQVEDKSGNEQEINNEEQQQAAKKKRYHRHTVRQIQEMEAYNNHLSIFIFLLDLSFSIISTFSHTHTISWKNHDQIWLLHIIITMIMF